MRMLCSPSRSAMISKLDANGSKPSISQKTFGQGAIAVAAPIPLKKRFPKRSPVIWVNPIRSKTKAVTSLDFMGAPRAKLLRTPNASDIQYMSAKTEMPRAPFYHQAHARREKRACPQSDPLANRQIGID